MLLIQLLRATNLFPDRSTALGLCSTPYSPAATGGVTGNPPRPAAARPGPRAGT